MKFLKKTEFEVFRKDFFPAKFFYHLCIMDKVSHSANRKKMSSFPVVFSIYLSYIPFTTLPVV